MIIRNCAGGVVFFEDKVLILKNDKGEWIFPKGVIRNGDSPDGVAVNRVKVEAGVDGDIISSSGRTNYEFYSVTRQRPVCNKISWYVMKADSDECAPNKAQNFIDAGYFPVEKALDIITYSQDRSLLMLSFQKYREIIQNK